MVNSKASRSFFSVKPMRWECIVTFAYLHKFGKGRTKRWTVVQRHASPIYQGSINEPRTHHPPKVGRPSHNISLMNIHMAPSISSRFQRRNVRPWDSLWLTYTINAKHSISTSSSSYHVVAVFFFSLAYRWFLMRKGCSCKFLLVSLQQYIPRLWKNSKKKMCVFVLWHLNKYLNLSIGYSYQVNDYLTFHPFQENVAVVFQFL